MNKFAVVLSAVLLVQSAPAGAFLGFGGGAPGEGVATTMAIKVQTAMQKAHYAIMEADTIKSIKIMYDNYIQSKQYYESIREASKHRGGLMGYYGEVFTRRVRAGWDEELWRIEQLKRGDPNNPLRKMVESGESYVESKIDKTGDAMIERMVQNLEQMMDYVDKMTKISKERDKEFEKLARDMSKNDLTDRDMDKLTLRGLVLQIEYLQAIDQGNRMMFTREARDLQREYLLSKRNQASGEAFFRGMDKQLRQNKKPDANAIYRELQKLPGEDRE